MENWLDIIQRRHEEFTARLPALTGATYTRYLESKGENPGPLPSTAPFWIHLSQWLAATDAHPARKDGFHSDSLWGQYCVFSSLRILDDVLDFQSDGKIMVLVPLFQSEARDVFRRHFSSTSSFWTEFDRNLQASVTCNIALGKMQAEGDYSCSEARALYASSSSAFKILVAAYNEPLVVPRRYRRLCSAVDHLVIAGQLIDDLADMLDDLRLGKSNFAVRLILERPHKPLHEPARLLAMESLWHFGWEKFTGEISQHVSKARRHLGILHLPDVECYLSSYDRWLEEVDRHIHRMRIAMLYRNLPSAAQTDYSSSF